VALASGTMASAAYWIGSAAQAVYITDGTTNVGSIGVVAKHMDVSAAEKTAGVKTTEIYAGKFKRIASQYEPLSDEGRQSIQDAVDYTYALFVEAVATQRGVSTETVLQNMADGRVFIGQQAIDAGLVDGVSTLGEMIQQLNESRRPGGSPFARRAGVAPRAQATPQTGAIDMPITREQLAADAPDVLAAVQAEAMASERQRVKDVRAQLIPGHEAVIERCLEDGSTPAEAAMAVNAAERNTRAANAKALASEAPQPLPSAPVATVEPSASASNLGQGGFISAATDTASLDAAARKHQATHPGVSYIAALKAVQQGA
jgi:ClpP class serine protease